ncbi:MAG TPA: hypothetical protein DEH22_07900, partial [Chloroflexi bacterium]|nr:hypothetical protein [Chloroflexota bacterium]
MNRLKQTLGSIPYTAELYWLLRQTGKPPVGGYSLKALQAALPAWVAQAQAAQKLPTGKKVFI